jgi:hypothetical protein
MSLVFLNIHKFFFFGFIKSFCFHWWFFS